jgi:hypothetical protein
MARQKSDKELKYDLSVHRGELVASTFRQCAKWAAVAYLGYLARDVLLAYAGKTTIVALVSSLIANVRVSVALAWGVGAGGVVYGWRQKKLRESTTERLTKRTGELESQIDGKRTSSGLTPRGKTRPGD